MAKFFSESKVAHAKMGHVRPTTCNFMYAAVYTSNLHAEGFLMENTSADISPVDCQANAGKLDGQKPEELAGIAHGVPQNVQTADFTGSLYSPCHGSVMGK